MNPSRPAEKSKRRLWVQRAGLGLVILLGIGAASERVAERMDLRRYPPPGQMVDIGGVRLHLRCEGTGSPTVVAESGAGQNSLGWLAILPAIAQETRICIYDRAGFGWSDYQAAVPTRAQVLSNLTSMLQVAEIKGPYVLVGHSLGGIYVRDFAQEFPTEVSGMVLVDSSHEKQLAHMPAELQELQESSTRWMTLAMRACRPLAFVGAVRALRVWSFLSPDMPEDVRAPYVMARNRSSFCPAIHGVLVSYADALNQDENPRDLGSIPLIVLRHGRSNAASEPELQWERTWVTLQAELAALSRSSQLRVVESAGHAIQIDRPDAVIEAILELVRRPGN